MVFNGCILLSDPRFSSVINFPTHHRFLLKGCAECKQYVSHWFSLTLKFNQEWDVCLLLPLYHRIFRKDWPAWLHSGAVGASKWQTALSFSEWTATPDLMEISRFTQSHSLSLDLLWRCVHQSPSLSLSLSLPCHSLSLWFTAAEMQDSNVCTVNKDGWHKRSCILPPGSRLQIKSLLPYYFIVELLPKSKRKVLLN